MGIKDRHEIKWLGRSLKNYIILHPKAEGARTLTEARRKAFGNKTKTLACRCGQDKCRRKTGYGRDSC